VKPVPQDLGACVLRFGTAVAPNPPNAARWSRKRRLTESSQPCGISPTGLRSPRTNARLAHYTAMAADPFYGATVT
jgi:hypothetical protein